MNTADGPGTRRSALLPETPAPVLETLLPKRESPFESGLKHHRCAWAVMAAQPEYLRYHDTEWGVPTTDDVILFEFLVLATAQTGLPWLTVLSRRESFRKAFAHFNAAKVARFNCRRQARLVKDSSIVRNKLKIAAAVRNAQRYLEIQEEYGSFAAYLWRFTDGRPVQNRFRRLQEIPASTPLSETISRDLKQRGFRFVGSKTVYAYLQAVGVVNDHLVGCFCHATVARHAETFCPPQDSH